MPTLRDQLIGTWRLGSYETKGEDGSAAYPMGQDLTGFIMYVPDGYMSANLMVSGRPAYTGGSADTATRGELAAAATGYFGYAGRFEIDEARQVVTHYLNVALVPNLVGTSQLRHVAIEGSRLILRGDPGPWGGRIATPIITWERVR